MKITFEIFERKLFILFILIQTFILLINIGKPSVEIWGINRTVGWAYDLTLPNLIITWSISLLFTLIYFALSIFKKKTNRIISVVHIVAYGITLFAYKFLDEGIIFLLNLLSIIIFLINVTWTLVSKKIKPAHNSG
jgi:hypothetical protein